MDSDLPVLVGFAVFPFASIQEIQRRLNRRFDCV